MVEGRIVETVAWSLRASMRWLGTVCVVALSGYCEPEVSVSVKLLWQSCGNCESLDIVTAVCVANTMLD